MFIDQAKFFVSSGKGGMACRFRREKLYARRPMAGMVAKGGDVYW